MAKNEFLPFGTAEGANVLAASEYENLTARHNGFTSGVAKSKELNKVWRQASVMASALAQFIVDTDKKDLLDDGNAPAVKNRLVSAMKEAFKGEMPAVPKTVQTTGDSTTDVMSQKSVTEALGKKAPSNVADGKLTKDQNGADIPDKPKFIENLGLGEAAKSGLKQGTGTSKTDVISQDGVTKALNGKLDKTGGTITATAKALEIKTRADASGYIQVSDENGNAIHQLGKTTAGNKLILRNVTEDATLTVGAKGVEFNGVLLGLINTALNGNNGGGWWRCASTGVIIQWGRTPAGATSRPINFPIPFTDAGYVVNHFDGGFRDNTRWGTSDRTKTGFIAMCNDASQGGNYIAIGF